MPAGQRTAPPVNLSLGGMREWQVIGVVVVACIAIGTLLFFAVRWLIFGSGIRETVHTLLLSERSVQIRSPYSLVDAQNRLRPIVHRTVITTLLSRGLIGKIQERRVRLTIYRPLFANSFSPVFDASFEEADGATWLVGRFRLHRFVRVFLSIWFGGVVLIGALLVPFGIIGVLAGSLEAAVMVFGPLLMLGFGIALVKLGSFFGAADERYILSKVNEALAGTVV